MVHGIGRDPTFPAIFSLSGAADFAVVHVNRLSGAHPVHGVQELKDPKPVGVDRYLAPGTRVRRDAYVNDDDTLTSEFGVVVHCWMDEGMGVFDCYIAFFGDVFPDGVPTEEPYVLRYAAIGLEELAD